MKKEYNLAIILCCVILLVALIAFSILINNNTNRGKSANSNAESINREIENSNNEILKLQDQRTTLEASITAMQAQVETEKGRLAQKQTYLQTLGNSATTEMADLQKSLDSESNKLSSEKVNYASLNDTYNNKSATFTATLTALEADIQNTKLRIADLERNITEAKSQLKTCNERLVARNNELQALIDAKTKQLMQAQRCMYTAETRPCSTLPEYAHKTKDGRTVICPKGYKLMPYNDQREICTFPFTGEQTPDITKMDAREASIDCYGYWPNNAWDYPKVEHTETTKGVFMWVPQGYVTDPMPANLMCNPDL